MKRIAFADKRGHNSRPFLLCTLDEWGQPAGRRDDIVIVKHHIGGLCQFDPNVARFVGRHKMVELYMGEAALLRLIGNPIGQVRG